MKKSALLFKTDLPRPQELGEELILIYDEILPRRSALFKKWLSGFERKYAVQAGESLKDLQNFPQHMQKILKLCQGTSARRLTIVVVGGGSVGDFGGFVASILKRGVRLVHVPSTWLAALDSAHGGKTALNVVGAKNQIGTFYPAEKVFLVKSLLLAQPAARAFEGFAELLKIAWLQGGNLWMSLANERDVDSELLWKYLKPAVQGKYRIVAQDPEEKKGLRHLLNLGHTLGHVLEVVEGLPHGIAVNYGLDFALRWSVQKKIMKAVDYERLREKPISAFVLSPARDHLLPIQEKSLRRFRELLLSDKKKTKASTLRFVFLKKPGAPVIREVTVDEVLIEVCRQREEDFYG